MSACGKPKSLTPVPPWTFGFKGQLQQRHPGGLSFPPFPESGMQQSSELYSLRQQLRQRRRALTPEQQQQAAQALLLELQKLPCFQSAQRIALYLASDGEIGTGAIIRQAQADGKQLFVPVVDPRQKHLMHFQQLLAQQSLHSNRYAIPEPQWQPQLQAAANSMDLILLPLVGFDGTGARLGMGGGYYDRALARLDAEGPVLLGLAHGCQQVEQIAARPWDVPLHGVVTEQGFIDCSQVTE